MFKLDCLALEFINYLLNGGEVHFLLPNYRRWILLSTSMFDLRIANYLIFHLNKIAVNIEHKED